MKNNECIRREYSYSKKDLEKILDLEGKIVYLHTEHFGNDFFIVTEEEMEK